MLNSSRTNEKVRVGTLDAIRTAGCEKFGREFKVIRRMF